MGRSTSLAKSEWDKWRRWRPPVPVDALRSSAVHTRRVGPPAAGSGPEPVLVIARQEVPGGSRTRLVSAELIADLPLAPDGETMLASAMVSLPRWWLALVWAVLGTRIWAQSPLPPGETRLGALGDFAPTTANWTVGRGVAGDPRREKTLSLVPGSGVLVNLPGPAAKGDLFTAWEHGDLSFDCEFLLPMGSNSGIYLMGRYEVQLFDSWGKRNPTFVDCGGIYERWDETRGAGKEGVDGVSPRANACRAPGLWQTLHVEFRAPRFDANGKKVENARFLKIELNGFLVQEDVEVAGPTRSAAFLTESPTGALMIQGSHGPIALRAIRCRPLGEPVAASKTELARKKAVPAYTIEATSRVRLQRGFVPFFPSKRLYAVSVGTLAGMNYAYDFQTGALLRAWRGSFVNTFEMWDGRGANQIASPAGPALTLNAKPALGVIEFSGTDGWPERENDLYSTEGYRLEADGSPVFLASLSGLKIADAYKPLADGKGLTRTLQCEGSLTSFSTFALLAEADVISPAPGGGYLVGDRQWYLDWPSNSEHVPVLWNTGGKQQLVVPLTKTSFNKPVVYTLVW